MGQKGADFHLPDEILSVVPTDPYEQLDLARRITSMAIASRVTRLDTETRRLRQKVAEKDRAVAELQDRLGRLEGLLQEAEARLRASLEENVKLFEDRDTLVLTTKKLSRELAKLEIFKRHLLLSLNEDNSLLSGTADIGTCDQSNFKSSCWKDDRSVGHTISNLIIGSTDNTNQGENVGQKLSMMPYISPRLTPSTTPKVTSTGASPRGFSAAGSPKMASGTTSPTKPHLEGQTHRIDGKEFFRQARSRLSYEQFGAFLANIKEFNAHRQTREETLTKAEEIFGTDNKDLYLSFQGLLYRRLP